MKRNAHLLAVSAAAVLASAACGAGEEPESDASPTGGEASTSQSVSPSPTEEALEALDGTDYESCYDGDCEVIVSEGTTFELDPAFGIDTMTITGFDRFTPEGGGTAVDRVMFEATGSGFLSMTLPVEGSGRLQGTLLVRALAISDGEAVLLLEPVA
ncbi:hypothetical protein [Glycomyces tarimensis]